MKHRYRIVGIFVVLLSTTAQASQRAPKAPRLGYVQSQVRPECNMCRLLQAVQQRDEGKVKELVKADRSLRLAVVNNCESAVHVAEQVFRSDVSTLQRSPTLDADLQKQVEQSKSIFEYLLISYHLARLEVEIAAKNPARKKAA